jgi:transcriptional regulator with XRE-family HTH domain
MTKPDLMQLLRQKCEELSQARVAAAIGYSPSAVNQALKGSYRGDLTNLLNRVAEVFGDETVSCPILGEIPLGKCAFHRRRPFAATNPLRVTLWRACRQCEKEGKR